MKEIFTVINRDYIIQFYEQSQKDDKGKYKFVDEKSSITEKENKTHSISFFHETIEGAFINIAFEPRDIIALAAKIKEIESRKCEPSFEDF